jgi:23S rRNA pseudouridine2605 synthase
VPQERLQKILSGAGVASRRKAEELITAGRVRVNGRVVRELGAKADPTRDRVEVDRRTISRAEPVTVLLNKPRGVVTTLSDPEGRPTVIDFVKGVKTRVYPVGRLDYATSGALLLTNDGELANALTHPRFGVEKVYLAKVRGKVSDRVLDRWRGGVDLGEATTRPARVFKVEEEESFTWLEITIKEGRNRQIRRMGEATGLEVAKLKRISFAGLTIEGLPVGKYRELTPKEIARLKRDYVNQGKPSGKNRGERDDSRRGKKPRRRRPQKGRRG